MLWSHSNRETFRSCPGWWNAQYGARTHKRVQTSEAARGDQAHQMLERLVHWRMSLGRAATKDEALAWLDAQIDDVTEEDGLVQSPKTDAAWILETAMPLFTPVFAVLDQASSWGTEADWYYDAKWERWSGTTEDFWSYARKNDAYGGIPDLWAIVGDRLHIWDWKSGKRYPKWTQLKDYALYGALAFPEVQTVRGSFVWLTQGITDTEQWTRTELTNHHRTAVLAEIGEIRGTTTFPLNPGFPQCNWCPVVECAKRKERKR